MSQKKSPARLLPVVLVAAGIGWYAWHWYQQKHEPFEWSGTVEARTAAIGSRAGGRVKEVLVKEGDKVTAGQALVTMEAADWPAQLAQAEAQLGQVQANYDKLRAGSRPEEIAAARARAEGASAALLETTAGARPEQVAAAQSRLAAAQSAVDKATKDAERMHKLASAGAAVPADVDNADIAQRTAVAQRDAAQHQVDELRNGSRREDVAQARARAAEQQASAKMIVAGTRIEDLRAAEAAVKGAQGRVDQIKTMLDELTIRAPMAARVEALDLRPGELLAPSATAATLIEDDQLYVRIYVPETVLGHIKVGNRVPITVDSFPGKSFEGVVQHINSVGEYSPRNLQTADERADQVFASRIGIVSGADQLRAGMAAFIQVPRE